jgi:hypothetical protein
MPAAFFVSEVSRSCTGDKAAYKKQKEMKQMRQKTNWAVVYPGKTLTLNLKGIYYSNT